MDTADERRGVHAGSRSREERAPGQGRRRSLSGMLAVLVSIVITTVAGPPGAGAAPSPSVNLGPLRPVSCKTLPSDPPLEAPLYAQNAGASPMADGWWCQLPHATRMPASFVAVQRELIPLPNLYGLYSTTYAPSTPTGAHGGAERGSEAVLDRRRSRGERRGDAGEDTALSGTGRRPAGRSGEGNHCHRCGTGQVRRGHVALSLFERASLPPGRGLDHRDRHRCPRVGRVGGGQACQAGLTAAGR